MDHNHNHHLVTTSTASSTSSSSSSSHKTHKPNVIYKQRFDASDIPDVIFALICTAVIGVWHLLKILWTLIDATVTWAINLPTYLKCLKRSNRDVYDKLQGTDDGHVGLTFMRNMTIAMFCITCLLLLIFK